MKTPAKVIKDLWSIVDGSDPSTETVAAIAGDKTKHPIVAAAVVIYMEGRPKNRKGLGLAFSAMVSELQRRGYLTTGTMNHTAKGLRLTRELERTQEFRELMESYEDLLDKVRKGGQKEGYRGPVPLR